MIENNQSKIKKVVFYSGTPRGFRSLLIGYLYEIAQNYPVILLSEKLDPQIKEILKDKTLFPKLEEIIPVYQETQGKMNLLKRYRHSCNLAKDIVQRYQPDIVVTPGHSFLESYLRRFAREINALNIFLVGFLFGQTKEATAEYISRIAYLKAPGFLPWRGKILFSKLRRYPGHFLCYWILPFLVGQKPFLKEPSCVLVADNSRSGGIDYFIVFSNKEYDILIKDGVPAGKIYTLTHPLTREGGIRKLFEKIHSLNSVDKKETNTRILTVMWPPEPIGFRRGDLALISKKELWGGKIEVIALAAKILKGWKIFIKPHPLTENVAEMNKTLKSISNQIVITRPDESVDKYIKISDVILGLSPASTVLFDTFSREPQKPTLSLDLQSEFGGDSYKNFNGVEYIDNKEKFINILKLIQENKYQKIYQEQKKEKLGEKEFPSLTELLEYLFKQKAIYG